jgi:glycosyltransferase involved in cell wall biosynthesis
MGKVRSMETKAKKLLIIAYAFPPHSVVGSMRPLRMAKYLKRIAGWSPVVLTVDMDFARNDYSLVSEIPSDVPVHRSWTIEPAVWLEKMNAALSSHESRQGPLPASRSRRMVRFVLRKACSWLMELFSIPDAEVFWNLSVIWKGRKIIQDESIRAVLVTSPPWSLQIAGYCLKKLTGIPWIADFRDPWTDIRRKNRPAVVDLLEKWLEKALLSQANLVLSTSEMYTNDLKTKYPGMNSEKFQTLHNGYDEEKFAAVPNKGNDKFTIVHLGTLYSLFRPEIFFDALAEWISARDDIAGKLELQFIGEIPALTEAALRERGLLNITRITGYVPHEEAIALCCRADVLLLALGTDPAVPRGWLPSKLFEYLALNRPILAYVAEGEAASMVRNINKGYVVSREDKTAIVEVLNDLFERKSGIAGRFIPWKNDPEAMEKLRQPHLMERLGHLLDSITE